MFFFWGAFSARDPGWAHYSVYGLLMMFLDVFGFESNTGTVFQLLDSPLAALTGIRLRSRPENMFAFIPTPALPTFLITEWVASHQSRECLLAMSGSQFSDMGRGHYPQKAVKPFFPCFQTNFVQQKTVRFSTKIHTKIDTFDAAVTSVACFCAGHRVIHKQNFAKLDVFSQKLLRSIVGPPGSLK